MLQSASGTVEANSGPRSLARAVGIFAIAGGLTSLVGWAGNIPRLTDWRNDGISIFPNTATSAVLSGLLLLLHNCSPPPRWRGLTLALAGLVATVGGLTLFEHVTGINLGIDTLLFKRAWGQTAATAPMRMGLPASLSFLMIGIALLLLNFGARGRGGAAALGVIVTAISMLSIIGYLYGARQMYRLPRLTGIALPSATMIFCLAVGVVASVPEREPMRSIRERSAAGLLARRALPILLVLSLVLGWLRVQIERQGLVDTAFGTALRTLTELALLSGFLWWAVAMVRAHEQALLQAKEAAEAANIAKDNFVATLSHELRTPLTPVLATLSAWEAASDLPPALRDDVQMIRRNIDLEARLIDDLLDLTRIVRGKLALSREIVDVHQLLNAVVMMYRSELQAGKFEVLLRLQAPRQVVRADPGRLQQVFWNLLKNAAKFTPEGGQIELASGNDGDGNLWIAVRDNGVGISREALARLFIPFEQGSDEIVKRYGGLGLGLTIARALVVAHGGEITAQSEGSDRGATFTVSLPVAQEAAHAEPMVAASPAAPDQRRRFRVLLVEDHLDTARALARLLKGNGHEVEVATSVREAVEAFDGGRFDFLVSDLGLPDGTGMDLIRQLRRRYGLGVPAIALSGFGMDDDVARCKEAGFNDHVTKPVNLQKLEATIQRVGAEKSNEVERPGAPAEV
jgi:signal transduction histidine kinase/ActR/RegA family two-component response regulator